MSVLEKAAQFGGFELAHAVWIASIVEEGELVCPFVVVTKGDERKVIPFGAEFKSKRSAWVKPVSKS